MTEHVYRPCEIDMHVTYDKFNEIRRNTMDMSQKTMVQQYGSYGGDMSHTKEILRHIHNLWIWHLNKYNGRACEIHNDVTYDRKIVIRHVEPCL